MEHVTQVWGSCLSGTQAPLPPATPASSCATICFCCFPAQAAVELAKQLQQRIKQRGCREEFVPNAEMLEQGKASISNSNTALNAGCVSSKGADGGQRRQTWERTFCPLWSQQTLMFGQLPGRLATHHVCPTSRLPPRDTFRRWSSWRLRPSLPRSWSGSAWLQKRPPSRRGESSYSQPHEAASTCPLAAAPGPLPALEAARAAGFGMWQGIRCPG